MMKRLLVATAIVLLLSSACKPQIFPPETLEGVDHNFDFSRWRAFPNQAKHQKIHLGGRIMQADSMGDTVTIVAMQLPIVEHPAYGPKDNQQRSGAFTILYPGKIDSLFLQEGNRLIVVGHTRPPIPVDVDNTPRIYPTVTAQCIHFWNTGSKDISDFSASGGGNEPLREETYCTTPP